MLAEACLSSRQETYPIDLAIFSEEITMEGNATFLPRLAAAISVVGILSGVSAQAPATAPTPTPTMYTLVTEPSAGLSSITADYNGGTKF